MAKAPDAFRTISEVSDALNTPAHVLRFWESKFSQINPVKGAGGRRYYRPGDISLLAGIKLLLHEQGMTIKGAQKLLREKGVKHVAGLTVAPQLNVVEEKPADVAEPDVKPVEDAPVAASAPNIDIAALTPTASSKIRKPRWFQGDGRLDADRVARNADAIAPLLDKLARVSAKMRAA